MLTKLLSRQTCAECRLCCHFDCYDIWNTPLLSEALRDRISELLPETAFISKGESSYLFRICPDTETFACPLLNPSEGCILGDEKPFECRIWPLALMELDGRKLISISPLCKAMMDIPLSKLLAFLKEGIADEIFAYGEANPDAVQPYDRMYPILLWKW